MKKLVFTLLVFLLTFTGAYAITGEIVEGESLISQVLSFFIPAILGSISALVSDAKKWIGSGQWDWDIFWSTKIRPFLYTLVLAVLIFISIKFVPFLTTVYEALSGVSLVEFTAYTLFTAASAIIDGFIKPTIKGHE